MDWETFLQNNFGILPRVAGGGSPGSSGYATGGGRDSGVAVGDGYFTPPVAVSRGDRETRTTGIGGGSPGGFLAQFGLGGGFASTRQALAWGFNPALKATDDRGGFVSAEQIEASLNDAVTGATLSSSGAGDYGVPATGAGGVHPGLVLLGLAAVSLVGYSFLKG